MVFEREVESTAVGPTEQKHRRLSTVSNPSESILLDFVDTVNSHLSEIVDTDNFRTVIHSTKHLCETIFKLLAQVSALNAADDQMTTKCETLKQKLDKLLDALKQENANSCNAEELMRTLNDIAGLNGGNHVIAAAVDSLEAQPKVEARPPSIPKTDKDKYNTKERRNSRYFVRSGDKDAIQERANSLKRAVTCVVEASGVYDHKPRHGSRKHSLAGLNIPSHLSETSYSSPMSPPPPPINIISPSSSQTQLSTAADVVPCLLPLPEHRRSSMDEYFFNSVNLPVPKQFADASRRSSGVPEPIKEEEGNGDTLKIETSQEKEYCYSTDGCVPYEVYERNLLRSSYHGMVEVKAPDMFEPHAVSKHMLCVPAMLEPDLMERTPILAPGSNVYIGEKMTIIDTDMVIEINSAMRGCRRQSPACFSISGSKRVGRGRGE